MQDAKQKVFLRCYSGRPEDLNKDQYYVFCFCVCSVDSVMPVSRAWVCFKLKHLVSGVNVLT